MKPKDKQTNQVSQPKKSRKSKSVAQPKAEEQFNQQPFEVVVEQQLTPEHGRQIALSVQKGSDLALKTFGSDILTGDLSKTISKVVSEHLSITELGMLVAEGHQVTEHEVTEALAGLCGISEEASKFKGVLTWAIGDAAMLANQIDGGSSRVLAQAIKERGVSKHTATCALAVCKTFPFSERMPGVSFTHHQEIHNRRKKIKSEKGLEALLKELREQGLKNEVMSCSELRARLKILCGEVDKEDEDDGEKNEEPALTGKFYYIDENGNVTKSTGLNRELCMADTHIVIDVDQDCVLAKNGEPYFSIKEHEADDDGIPN